MVEPVKPSSFIVRILWWFACLLHLDAPFNRIFVAGFVSNTGTWCYTIGVSFLAFHITGNISAVGLTFFFAILPTIPAPIIGGMLADKYDEVVLMFSLDAVAALIASVPLFVHSTATVPLLWISAFGLKAVSAFYAPAQRAWIARFVAAEVHTLSKTELHQLITVNQWTALAEAAGLLHASELVHFRNSIAVDELRGLVVSNKRGAANARFAITMDYLPTLTGQLLIFAALFLADAYVGLALNVVSFAFSTLLVGSLPRFAMDKDKSETLSEVFQGYRVMLDETPTILPICIASAGTCIPVAVFQGVGVAYVLHLGWSSTAFPLLMIAMSVGGIFGSRLSTHVMDMKSGKSLAISCLFIGALALGFLSFTAIAAIALSIIFLSFAADSIGEAYFDTFMQTRVDNQFQARLQGFIKPFYGIGQIAGLIGVALIRTDQAVGYFALIAVVSAAVIGVSMLWFVLLERAAKELELAAKLLEHSAKASVPIIA